ncbi:MAG TPA: DUF6526 family protein [Thermoanaerobaculia bacterium]|nr:DUF6526 family protein [Thermoanaerobaculia bacterium]
MSEQSYANHKRYYWPYHFVALPILIINVLLRLVNVARFWAWWNLWEVLVALALVAVALAARVFALTVQNRLIRFEERARLRELGVDPSGFSTSQLIAMRFCANDELPELARCIADENLRSGDAIKRRIRNWRPDYLRA